MTENYSLEDLEAFRAAIEDKNATIVENFLKNGLKNSDIESIFPLALQCSSPQVVQKFLDFGASIENNQGKPPLFFAVLSDNLEVVNFLLRKGVSLKPNGEDVLHYALQLFESWHRVTTIQLLIDYGADINIQENEGPLILEILFRKVFHSNPVKDVEIRSLLLKLFLLNDANPNYRNVFSEETLLELAINNRDQESVKLLLLNGADINFLNSNKKVPLKFAIHEALRLSEKYETCQGFDSLTNNELDNLGYDKHIVNINWKIFKTTVRILPFRLIVRILTQETARRLSYNRSINEQNLTCIYSQYVNKYYERCRKEIELMKKTRICDISYFDILVANHNRLMSLCRNKDVKLVLESRSEVAKLFPEYAEFLYGRIEIGSYRRHLLDSSYCLLERILRFKFPFVIVDHIFGFLSNRNLRNLNSAFNSDMFSD